MSHATVTQRLLENKRPDSEEYFVNLFEYCNLKCPFCWQDHTDKNGMETVLSKSSDLLQLITASDRQHHVVNLMGGEIFADDIDDATFKQYYQLVERVHERALNADKSTSFNFVTNLVFTNTSRIRQLIDYLDCIGIDVNLATSWDPIGRFNRKTLFTFYLNLSIFEKDIRMVSVVLTNQCIRWFLTATSNDLAGFNEIRSKLPIFFDTYSPEKSAARYTPKDSEMLAMYLKLIDDFPNTYPVSDWIESRSTVMSCRSSHVIEPNGYAGKCGSLVPPHIEDSMAVPVDIMDNTAMEDEFVRKHECLSCEYFGTCGLGCFLLDNMKGRADVDGCIFKVINKHIVDMDTVSC